MTNAPASCFLQICINSCVVHPVSLSFPAHLLTPMSAQNTTSQPAPAALVEYLAALVQNSSLPLSALIQNGLLPVPTTQSPAPPAVPSTVAVDAPPSAEGRSFTRLGRGQGGALAEKQKASKDITASSTKHKLLVVTNWHFSRSFHFYFYCIDTCCYSPRLIPNTSSHSLPTIPSSYFVSDH